jgi:hypothetical protein
VATVIAYVDGFNLYHGTPRTRTGYCPDHGTGVSCPIGVVSADG